MNRISELRNQKGLTMRDAARLLNIPYTTYVNYEKGTREPNSEMLIKLARFYDTSIDYMIGKSSAPSIPAGLSPVPQMDTLPLVGSIACGTPILAEQNITDRVQVPSEWRADFVLTCKGDSMAPKILDGDLVAIRQQEEVENGQIAAVLIGDDATLKRVRITEGGQLQLWPINPDYEVIVPDQSDSIRIEGLAVGFFRAV